MSKLYLFVIVVLFNAVIEASKTKGHVKESHLNCDEVCVFNELIADCQEKNLTYIPFSDGCTNVVHLKLGDNHIPNLSYEQLSGYADLKTLDVSRNQISVVNRGTFRGLKQLRNILLNHNQLNGIANGTFEGTEIPLRRVIMNNNEIEFIDKNAFSGLHRIYCLYLNFNRIQTLPKSVFRGLQGLQSLHLNNNRLKTLDQNVFLGLTSLQNLYLNGNNLKWLTPGLFDGLQSLKKVNLSDNKLIAIPSPRDIGHNNYDLFEIANNFVNLSRSIIPYLNASGRLYIDGNPFICDCDFLFVQQWYHNISQAEKKHYQSRDPIMCEGYLITDILPVVCDSTNSSNLTGREESTLASNNTSNVSSDPTSNNKDFTEKGPIQKEGFTTIKACESANKKKETSFMLLLFTAIIITLFFILWIFRIIRGHM